MEIYQSFCIMSLLTETMSQKDFVEVFIRVRDSNQPSSKILYSDKNQILVDKNSFKFDYVFPPKTTQDQIFDKVGKKTVQNAIKGYNSCILVYGQTGSGKTYTMSGHQNGLMQKCFRKLFQQAKISKNEIAIKCSYCQIYNEQIADLLDTRSGKRLSIRQDCNKGVFIQNLEYVSVQSQTKIQEYLQIGLKNRRIGQTQMNQASSRSHSLFQVMISNKRIQHDRVILINSRMYFVDLAGSERQKSTNASGQRLKEANNINKSLTNLGIVIKTLSEGKQSNHIPYRNSKLTHILKSCISKHSKTYIIATISNDNDSIHQTISTLKFANRAKMIPIFAKIQENILIVKKQVKQEKQKEKNKFQIKFQQKTKKATKNASKLKADIKEDNFIQNVSLRPLQTISQCQASEQISTFRPIICGNGKNLQQIAQNQTFAVQDISKCQQQRLKHRIQIYRNKSIEAKQQKQSNKQYPIYIWNIPNQSSQKSHNTQISSSFLQQIQARDFQIQLAKAFQNFKILQLNQNLQLKQCRIAQLQENLQKTMSKSLKSNKNQYLEELKLKVEFYEQKFKFMESQYKKMKKNSKSQQKIAKFSTNKRQKAFTSQIVKKIQSKQNITPNIQCLNELQWRNVAILTKKYQNLKSNNSLLLSQNVFLKKRVRNLEQIIEQQQQDCLSRKRKVRKLNQ